MLHLAVHISFQGFETQTHMGLWMFVTSSLELVSFGYRQHLDVIVL
jgi:hypothetical protein